MDVTSPLPIHISSHLSGPIDVLQESRAFGHNHTIARSISHKNRVFGQSHWMNGFIVFRDVIEILEPTLRDGTSKLLAKINRAKILARVIKSERSPTWPTLPINDLPQKEICDVLMECYLHTFETVYRILHIPTFRKEYDALWTSTQKHSTASMIQIKLVLAIGAIFNDDFFSMRTDAIRWVYEAQTWLSSPNLKSRLGIQYLQTKILLLLAREYIDVGSEFVWISAGALIREAIYIGLHKNPAHLPRMTAFESEMRRRIWNTILEIEINLSLVSGGPCLISLEDFNSEPPGNFDDEQLEVPNPCAHPDAVYTQTSLAIALRKTFPMRLTVVKFLNDVATSGTYDETLRIDSELRATYKTLRHTLQAHAARPAATPCFALEVIEFIMQRYISSLHIPYFNPSLHEATYAFSRKAVLDSSLKIWNLARPVTNISETDIARLCRCGAGFFRIFAFQASLLLAVELRVQLQEADSIPRPDLLSIPDDAAHLVLRSIESGETGIKGYLLICMLKAQIDGIRQGIQKDSMPGYLTSVVDEAVDRCLIMLEKMAGLESSGQTANFDLQVSDFVGDWDLIISDLFNFDGMANLDSVST
ncbi:hypothetical protein GQ44DRAFT_701629 [Phaeosphaeriaceae sp. PMI808]|nr:hypothetical protein GQ44DRAFT_701629 [Phaeosphaeriaceae sp. PMI808]